MLMMVYRNFLDHRPYSCCPFSELPCPGAPAYQGEHNAEILTELQVSSDQIRDLEKRNITLSRR
jgi:crotonobetainyl-CoA:carnitine CoA-transferase CaiB-like acyl-CoA transferase